MNTFSKKDIKNRILAESDNFYIIEKKNIKLIDEDDSNAFVEPSNNNSSSLASDLYKTKTENPTDDTFIVNANSYDNDTSNNTVTFDIHGNNAADATKNFQQLTRNPQVKGLMNTTNVNAKIHLRNEERVIELRENSIPFSKKEMKEFLKK